MCGNARLADVGGPGFLLPLPQKDKVHTFTLNKNRILFEVLEFIQIHVIDKNSDQVQYVISDMTICIDTNKPYYIYLLRAFIGFGICKTLCYSCIIGNIGS